MRTIDVIESQSSRNQHLRLLMLLIIAGTFPFYCFAIYFIGSAPVEWRATDLPGSATPAPSLTPLGANLFLSPSATAGPALFATHTPLRLPVRTPRQFVPPTAIALPTQASPTPLPTATPPPPTVRPTSAIQDADFDGIADDADSCPSEYGYGDNNGCPYPDDGDRDGVRDAADACPQEFAPESPRGCRDFDGDGLDTAADDCPDQAGPSANRGCPLTGEAGG